MGNGQWAMGNGQWAMGKPHERLYSQRGTTPINSRITMINRINPIFEFPFQQ
jgi:hypothetical protein